MGLQKGIIAITVCIIVNFGSVVVSEDDMTYTRSYCHNITSTEEDETTKALDSDTPTEINRDIKCYWQCYMKEFEWMDHNGDISEKPNITPEPCWVKYASVCLEVTGDDHCDKAFNFMQCFAKNTKKEQASDKSCN